MLIYPNLKKGPLGDIRIRKALMHAIDREALAEALTNGSEYQQLAEALQANLAEVGIKMKLDVVDVSQFTQFYRPPTRGDILMGRYGGLSDPIQTVHEIVGSGGSYAPGGVASPEIDELLGQARRMAAADPKRVAVMQNLARAVSEHVATIPMITRANVYASKPGCVLNLEPYLPSGDDRFNDVWISAGCK